MNCKICDIVDGKTKAKKLYEDENFLAVLNPTPAVYGHAMVMPKKHLPSMSQVEDVMIKKMFFVAQQLSGILFEATGAAGTNVMISEGPLAGQKHQHFLVHIVPRTKDDGLNFEWQPKQLNEQAMNQIYEMLKVQPEALKGAVEKKETEKKPVEEQKKEPVKSESYLLKQLKRMP